MRWLVFAALLVIAAGVASCLARNPSACDGQHKDCPIGQTCNLSTFKCELIQLGDAGEDFAVGDLGELDFKGADAGDLARVCDTSDQCTDPNQPVCTPGGQCRSCAAGDNAECALHSGLRYCEADAGHCIECTPATQSTSCTNLQKPFCGVDGACRGCAKDVECATDVCQSDGSCADKKDIYYVDNGGALVTACKAGGTHDGLSKATAFCDIQDAIGSRKIIKVYGHAGFSYGEVVVTSGDYTIIGPGVGVTDPVTIFPLTNPNPGVSLASNGNAALTLIGVEVGKTGVSTSGDAVNCTNSGAGMVTLTMHNCLAQQAGSNKHGVQSSSCKLILDGNRIAFNLGGGVNLSLTTKYTLINNFIYRNGSTAVTIDPSVGASGIFQFNTIAHNTKAAAGAGGIECGTAMALIESSIFWMNTPADSAGSCVFVNSDVGALDPSFVNEAMDDYRIQTTNAAIIDKVTATVDGGGALPGHDFFNTHRPLGNGWDVGAHEKQ